VTETLTPTNFAGLRVSKASERSRTMNMLIFGESGVGKTWLAASAVECPTLRKVLYVDAEAGDETIKEYWPQVEILRANKWSDYDRIYNALLAGGHEYRTVVLDSISEILEHCKDATMEEMKADPENEARDEDIPSVREWGKILSRMLRLVRRFRDLPLNVIFIAHAENVKQSNGKSKWMPLVNGKFQMKLPQIPDVVLFMYVQSVEGETKRLLLTQQTDKAVAKVRGVTMPQVIGVEEEVTMKQILSYYTKAKDVK
jgi:hypothetical protein